MHDEENIPAQQSPQEEDPRLSRADADARRAARAQGPPGQGAQASQRLRNPGEPEPGRLRRSAEYRRIYREGVRIASRWFVVFGVPVEGPSRFGITASRKIGNAVVRNRSKRRVRVLARRFLPPRGIEIVVNVRRGLAAAPWPDLEWEFGRCLRILRSRLGSPSGR